MIIILTFIVLVLMLTMTGRDLVAAELVTGIQAKSKIVGPVVTGPMDAHYVEGMDTTLTTRDLVGVAEELLVGVQAKSRMLGRVLGLPQSTVDAIHEHYDDQLLNVIAEFLEQKETRPTWRVIINALRSPLIGEHVLANKIERRRKHSGKRSPGDLSKADIKKR